MSSDDFQPPKEDVPILSNDLTYFIIDFFVLSIFPAVITRIVQGLLYQVVYFNRDKPGKSSDQYKFHTKVIFVALYLLYTAWSFYTLISIQPENHYNILNLSKNFKPTQLKKLYSKLSISLHPDKNPNHLDLYLKVKKSYETLKSDQNRFFYEVFGDKIFNDCATKCLILKDFIMEAMHNIGTFYFGTFAYFFCCCIIGIRLGFYWKFLIISFSAIIHLGFIFHYDSLLVQFIRLALPNRMTLFQVINLMYHMVWNSCFILGYFIQLFSSINNSESVIEVESDKLYRLSNSVKSSQIEDLKTKFQSIDRFEDNIIIDKILELYKIDKLK